LRSVNPDIVPAVEAVILKALEKNPKNRYQTGAKLMSALAEAFKTGSSSPKMSLPPLPVGVPTIRQTKASIEEVTQQLSPRIRKGDTIYQPIADIPAATARVAKPKKNSSWMWILPLLLLLGIGGWYFTNGKTLPMKTIPLSASSATPAPPTLTEVPALPTQTLVPPSATLTQAFVVIPSVPSTETFTPAPSPTVTFTPTLALTNTPAPSPTIEQASATSESTSTPVPSPAPVSSAPTVKYPDGNHFTLFWNETSFHMLNRAREARSFSGFTFERLGQNDSPTDTFKGYLWENAKFKNLGGKYCVSIKIYKYETPPYIDPIDCHGAFVSIVQPRKDEDRALLFWNPKEGSSQFRVLWLNEEIARCEISAGTCELYVP
jgi:serine/threonine protein kinase